MPPFGTSLDLSGSPMVSQPIGGFFMGFILVGWGRWFIYRACEALLPLPPNQVSFDFFGLYCGVSKMGKDILGFVDAFVLLACIVALSSLWGATPDNRAGIMNSMILGCLLVQVAVIARRVK